MSRARLLAPLLALVFGWQLLGALGFEWQRVRAYSLSERLRRARAPLEERLRNELGEHRYGVYRALIEHVPPDAHLSFVTSDFNGVATSLILYTGLVYPRWMQPAVKLPGLDLSKLPPQLDLYLVDLDSSFGLDFAAHCERVEGGDGFTLWHVRGAKP